MCGIVGYVGQQQAAPILLNGLSKLEYRGYDSAGIAVRNEQGEIEARIADLEVMLKHVRVLDSEELDTNSVTVGTTVALEDLDEEDEEDKFITYSISGATEANPDNNIISDESPVGSGLLGKAVGDVAEILLPTGHTLRLKVREITRTQHHA